LINLVSIFTNVAGEMTIFVGLMKIPVLFHL